MNLDIILILFVIAIIVVGIFFKDFKSVVYFIAIVDILFRLLHKISSMIVLSFFNSFVNNYIPGSVEAIINSYSSGILNTILIWLFILMYIYFEVYLIKYWINKKK